MNLIAAILLATQPMTVSETRSFMRTLTQYVLDHHLKKDEKSAQRGMIYEYYDVKSNLWVQGEGLDTMHDGAWFAVAMVNAYRATGDPFYKEVLTKWQLPFYLKMLNHGDELFTSERNDGRPGGARGWQVSKEWLLQGREKGFVPYWWDDGASVSLDMRGRRDNDEHVNFAGRNDWGNRPNPEKRLSGYSFGSSNHMALDLAVMLQQTWLLLRDSEIAEAAKNLQECRARHGSPNIPSVKAALALTTGNTAMRRSLREETWKSIATARSDWRRALYEFKPNEPVKIPGFADDQQCRYYVALARDGTLSEPAAFHLIYDAFTLPQLYRMYCDDEPPAPGINIYAPHHTYTFVNGKPADYRSQRKGPLGGPRPIGSRFGPQNMVLSGCALQALKAYPGLWDKAKTLITTPHFFPPDSEKDVQAALERELGGGLRTWEAIFKKYGYIPTSIGAGHTPGGFLRDDFSDTGGYAHLISAASQWIFCLEGKRDWEQHQAPLPQ